jgi:hypothetical protein
MQGCHNGGRSDFPGWTKLGDSQASFSTLKDVELFFSNKDGGPDIVGAVTLVRSLREIDFCKSRVLSSPSIFTIGQVCRASQTDLGYITKDTIVASQSHHLWSNNSSGFLGDTRS